MFKNINIAQVVLITLALCVFGHFTTFSENISATDNLVFIKNRSPLLMDYNQAKDIAKRSKNGTATVTEKFLVKKLLTNAEGCCKAQKLPSVMDKKMIADSGNKHDYFSMGPYWWPNPDGANGLPYIRKDGVSNPERNKTDAVPLSKMTNAVKTLVRAWFYSGDVKYADKAIEYLRVWFLNPETKMNPNLDYAQAIPGVCKGRGIGIIDTGIWPELIDMLILLEECPKWTNEDRKGMKQWFDAFYYWMKTSQNGLDEAREKNNHGCSYDLQTVCYALYLEKNEEARNILSKVRNKRLNVQIMKDGSMPRELARTKSISYTTMNLNILLKLTILAQRFDIDLWNKDSAGKNGVEAAFDFLLPYLMDGKKWDYQNINKSDPHKVFGNALHSAWKFSKEERYKTAYEKVNPGLSVEDLRGLP